MAGQLSPSNSLHRTHSDTASTHFPLNDIDYESNPNAVAQELSNLAAIRRMSMDVNASGDPDLPSFPSNFGMPTAPPMDTDPDDASRLYWVPASVHPELAPMEFKTFLDKKVKSLKRRSEESSLSPDGLKPGGSSASLRRRKSMLSRQIDNSGGRGADGYQDGAEVLDRKRSQSGDKVLSTGITNLQDLEALVNEPEKIMQRLSLETGAEGGEVLPGDDVPILPGAPSGGNSLRRSTRTTYRRGGSLRKGERGPMSKRAAFRSDTTDGEELPISAPSVPQNEAFEKLSRAQTEPTPPPERVTENFSRPGRMNRRAGIPPGVSQRTSLSSSFDEAPTDHKSSELRDQPGIAPHTRHFVSQIASNGRLGVTPEALGKGIPHIIETPPEEARPASRKGFVPERTTSHEPPPIHQPSASSSAGPSRAQKWTPQSRQNQSIKSNQSLSDMTSHPSPLPGNNTRTDSLSFIPTLTEDKKSAEARKAKEKADQEKADSGRKSSWSWGSLLGNEEREKEKRKAEEAKQEKKVRARLGKPLDKSHENTRLDLLQTTMEGSRGRESIVLDRGDLKLEEERKKESSRKSSGNEGKKEKEGGFISSIFGGGKKKGEQESRGKKHFSRNLSPEPPMRILKPDIDYNWTRFSILEERAIYRMAHIKLANPRRALHSQVLLSNFMYSYLAKVQQMHPQAQLPQSAAQRQQAAQQKKDQPEEFAQYQKYQQQQQRQQEEEEAQQAASVQSQVIALQSQVPTLPALAPVQQHDSFMDDYEHENLPHDNRHRPQSRASQHSQDSGNGHPNQAIGSQQRRQGYNNPQLSNPYQYQQSQFDEPGRAADDDMW
ncbi:hypothetical protein HO133_007810 [Letharia lupina]|uniref:Protein Zds1 C-terminal domain-containing protein n=1 Tax=Letharia lupina TaxID=560253 RepID=A0A8H6FGV5_9LECA|nr:uncharacterized protein HO133_007810 [Letharia lupina]KAF6228082.1 hypothetical protein HO133_007810 [Letharia lupina]